jgi:LCP family protein required for cell wall assembly
VAGVVLLPGLALLRKWPVLGTVLLIAGVLAPFFTLWLIWDFRDHPLDLFSRTDVLRGMVVVVIAAAASRLIAVWLTAGQLNNDHQRARLQRHGTVAVLVMMMPLMFASWRTEQARGVVDDVFADSPGIGAVQAAVSDPLAGEFETVLLLGGDEGRNRVSLRTDTMILAMVHRSSGRTALVSIPRNLQNLQFSPGTTMAEHYPDGFDDLANAVYPEVANDVELTDALGGDDSPVPPGIQALMQGISYSFGVTIDDYLLINMCGFVSVVDAIGGITIDVEGELPMPGGVSCSNYRLEPTIGPGPVYMDGTKALGYVRSRAADSDYRRMDRQRVLLTSILDEIGLTDLILNFGKLASAARDNVRTSMTEQEALRLLETLSNSSSPINSIGLVPPTLEPSDPDFSAARQMLQDERQRLATGGPLPTP